MKPIIKTVGWNVPQADPHPEHFGRQSYRLPETPAPGNVLKELRDREANRRYTRQELERFFGPKSVAKLADRLRRESPEDYKAMRREAELDGLIGPAAYEKAEPVFTPSAELCAKLGLPPNTIMTHRQFAARVNECKAAQDAAAKEKT